MEKYRQWASTIVGYKALWSTGFVVWQMWKYPPVPNLYRSFLPQDSEQGAFKDWDAEEFRLILFFLSTACSVHPEFSVAGFEQLLTTENACPETNRQAIWITGPVRIKVPAPDEVYKEVSAECWTSKSSSLSQSRQNEISIKLTVMFEYFKLNSVTHNVIEVLGLLSREKFSHWYYIFFQ